MRSYYIDTFDCNNLNCFYINSRHIIKYENNDEKNLFDKREEEKDKLKDWKETIVCMNIWFLEFFALLKADVLRLFQWYERNGDLFSLLH